MDGAEVVMALIPWGELYATGIEKVDADHRGLFDLMNELFAKIDASGGGAGRDEVGRALDALDSATRSHFTWEEQELRSASYSDLDGHLVAHERLLAKLYRLAADFRAGGTLGPPAIEFFKLWLGNHILGTDHLYVPTVKRFYVLGSAVGQRPATSPRSLR
ncbi:MAG: bacteriohemerythrin [Deltaproteobacteria bacterium]|nr:bacteriohemerythrin [Deltaproteobacteria bacterium]